MVLGGKGARACDATAAVASGLHVCGAVGWFDLGRAASSLCHRQGDDKLFTAFVDGKPRLPSLSTRPH